MCAKGGKKNKKSPSHRGKSFKRRKSRSHSQTRKKIISASRGKEKQKDKREPTRRPISARRLWLFRVLALTVIPALLFLLLELGLRIVGYGFPSAAILKCEVDGQTFHCDNVKFGWRFFPRNIAREFDPFIFPAKKTEDTYRVFILGASAAKGEPDSAFCFGRFLEVMLRQAYPGINFEVITAATAAINSHAVLEIAGDCARHQPDLFIVYLGNNEVVGPYGAGTVFSPFSGSLSLIRMGIALKTTRLGQLLTNLLESVGPKKNIPQVWSGLEMFLEKQVRPEDERLETVYRHFERNLKDISRVARGSGAKVIFCTVASNLKDCPPFASLHEPSLTEMNEKKWDRIYQQGVTNEEENKYSEAVKSYLAAAAIDDYYADLQFRLGRCYWVMGEYGKARDRYIRARELDTLRFRADNRINETICAVAGDKTEEGVYLTDTVKIFEKNSPHDTTGQELFYEHVHLNIKGTYLLSKTIFEQVEQILPGYIKRRKESERPLLTEAQYVQHLAYTDWDRYIITEKVLNGFIRNAPFTNQLYHEEHVKQVEQTVTALKADLTVDVLQEAAAQYRRAIQDDGRDWHLHYKYGKLLTEDFKDYRAAAEQYRLVQEYFPHSYTGYNALGNVLRGMGDLDGAIDQYLKTIKINPVCAEAYRYLGWAYKQKGKVDKAIEHYSQSIRIVPTNPNVYFSLGLIYQGQERLDEAVEYYRQALRLKQDYAKACNNLALALYQQGKLDEAIKTYRQGLLLTPNSLDLHHNLAVLLNKQGLRDEAIKEFRAALRIDPNSAKTRRALEATLKSDRKGIKAPKLN
ncbi:MAG: tetratricopeptide repeat protein [Phycisphaerae bacterium]|nr:tetratricopeptide repeat protein [Phycisphaerae bacterium]NIP51444.1 tetratricopeptide repeat protein [Phycisphaerae bacterium]NIS50648.1 tetratricopeptide repeat protein [Phycisphaerae bacterium]NIU08381.1 tetratricopeptide repeat protein [Phycisphaerae bacterium]NIU55880.1 tetratricopeptide repeat protein [Phycisphaerae bacterium]